MMKRHSSRRNDSKKNNARYGNSSDSDQPSYQVEENSDGELVNYQYNLKWPQKICKKKTDYVSTTKSSDTSGREQDSKKFIDTPSEYERREKNAQYIRLDTSNNPTMYENFTNSSESLSAISNESIHKYPFMTDRNDQPIIIDSRIYDTRSEMCRKQDVVSEVESTSDMSTVPSDDVSRHYVGVCSKKRVEKKLKSGEFLIYYEKPSGSSIPLTIDLKLAYMSSNNTIYHFPIKSFERSGEKYFVVMQNTHEAKTFPSVHSLVKHYHTYADVDPKSGRMETFKVPY